MPPTPDPLQYLPVPAVPPNGIMIAVPNIGGGFDYTLTPGRYSNLPNFGQNDTVTMKQAFDATGTNINNAGGIYYLDSSGFTSTGANVTMDTLTTSGGLMIYNGPSTTSTSQGLSISGNAGGKVILSGLESGPYQGLLLWQSRTAPQQMGISGNGIFKLVGTFYAPGALLKITGSATVDLTDPPSYGSMYISRQLNLSGNGNILMNYQDDKTPKVREVTLVE